MARVLIVDDHPLLRHAFKSIMSSAEGLEAVGESQDGLEAIEACGRLRPDLVLMDLSMPRMGGIEATRRIKGSSPETVVLVVTADDSENLMLEAVRAGAAGYVLKSDSPWRLLEAARAALAGESPIDAGLAGRLVRRLAAGDGDPGAAGNGRPAPAPPAPAAVLTLREAEVLAAVVAGKTNRTIAEELHMSLSTVKRHLQRIVSKLGVSDRTQAAVRATELGLLPR